MSTETTKLSKEQLHGELKAGREQLFKLRQQAATDKVADTSSFKKSRKQIARLLTEINARRHDAGKTQGAKAKPSAKKK